MYSEKGPWDSSNKCLWKEVDKKTHEEVTVKDYVKGKLQNLKLSLLNSQNLIKQPFVLSSKSD